MAEAIDYVLTVINAGLVALNLWLVFKQYTAQMRQFEYERKPQITVKISSLMNRISLELTNQGTVPASNLSLALDMILGDERPTIGRLTIESLNPDESTCRDLTDDLFACLEKRGVLYTYCESIPTGIQDQLTDQELYEEITIHHLKKSVCSYDLNIKGNYGSDISIEPVFALEYVFRIELKMLEYDYAAGKDYQLEDDFETIVRPQTGNWERVST